MSSGLAWSTQKESISSSDGDSDDDDNGCDDDDDDRVDSTIHSRYKVNDKTVVLNFGGNPQL